MIAQLFISSIIAICAILGLVFGYFIYQRVIPKEIIIAKKTETVLELFEAITSTQFMVNDPYQQGFISLGEIENLGYYHFQRTDSIIVTVRTIEILRSILSIGYSLYMPRDISQVCKQLRPVRMNPIDDQLDLFANRLRVSDYRDADWSLEDKNGFRDVFREITVLRDATHQPPRYWTVKEFQDDIESLLSTCAEWLKANSKDDLIHLNHKKFD